MQDLLTPEERKALRVRVSHVPWGVEGSDAARRALEKAERAKSPEHEGYSSRETWGVGLVLSGSMDLSERIDGYDAYRRARALAAELVERIAEDPESEPNIGEGIWTVEQTQRYRVAEALEEFVKDSLPDLGGSLAADLLGCALCEVDWDQLAGHALQTLAEEGAPIGNAGRPE